MLYKDFIGWAASFSAPPQQAASAPTPAAPAVPADGVTEEVKVAILMALMQQPGFRMEDVRSIDIRRA